MNVLVLGVAGMLGSAVFRQLLLDRRYEVWGTLRQRGALRHFPGVAQARLLSGVDMLDANSLVGLFEQVRPQVVINCVGLIKQRDQAQDPLVVLPINAMLPHRLARLCALTKARLIHISTDCVFSGRKGGYTEQDVPDAEDLYGRSKLIGELADLPHALTLRTSIIGHELDSHLALLDWFLARTGRVKGYRNAVFSGLPTVELARVIQDHVLPMPALHGLYHVAGQPIDKFSLLELVAQVYGKEIELVADDSPHIDRSLDASRFCQAVGYTPASWPELVKRMHAQR